VSVGAGAIDEAICTPNDSDGTVTIWHSMGGPAAVDLWAEVERNFEQSHAIELEVVDFGGDRGIVDKLEVTPRSQWPDIINVSERNTLTLLDTQQFLAPAACDESFGDDLLPLVRATYSVNGQLAAAPFGVSTPVLVFDAAEFRAAGLDPAEPPLTLADLIDASRTIAASGASPYGLVLTDACANMVLDQFNAKRGVSMGTTGNGPDERSVSFDFVSDESVADLTMLAEAVAAGNVKYIGGSVSNLDDLLELSNTTDDGASMTVHTSGALGDVIALLGNFPGVELGVGPLPGPGPGAMVGGNALWITSNSDAEQVGRAWSFVDWVYQPAQLARLAIEAGYVPPTESAAQDPALLKRWQDYPQLKVAYEQVLATEVSEASAGSLIGPFNTSSQVMFETCDKIMASGADVRTSLQAATTAVNDLVAQYEAQRTGQEVPPPSSAPAQSPVARTVSGSIECASGAAMVGVWVEAESGPSQNKGWATFATTGPATATFQFTLKFGGRYQLHVGCGGTTSQWGSTSFTNFVSSSSDFLCHDAPPSRGSCDTL